MHNCKDRLCETPHYEEPIDTGFTDDTIIVKCGECDIEATGVNAMMSHIIDFHKEYSLKEAKHFAEIWVEAAHEQAEEDYINNQEAAGENALEDKDD